MKTGEYLTVGEAAKALKVSPSTVWRWIQSERLAAYRVGLRTIRIRREDLEALAKPIRAGSGVRPGDGVFAEPTPEELVRRQALVARIHANRKERSIAPLTASDLVRKVREEEEESYGAIR